MSASQVASLFEQCLDLHRAGKVAGAEKLYVKLLKLAPNDPEIVRHFAILQFQRGRQARAVEILTRACTMNPRSAALEYSLGNMLLQMGRPSEAAVRFQACLAVAPDFADALANLGAALRALGRYAEAMICLRRASELLPTAIGPRANLAAILLFMNDYSAAEEVLKQALAINPDAHEQRLLLAQTQSRTKKYADAIANYQKLLAVHPNHLLAQSGLLHTKLQICDWDDFEALRGAFMAGLSRAGGKGAEGEPSPYTSLLVCDDPADCLTVARARAMSLSNRPRLSAKGGTRKANDKIRIAYLSADYREHATSYLISELIESHDRSAFEVTGLSFGPTTASPMRTRMENAFDRFEDVSRLSASAIANRLADLSIDIAIDLQGFNQFNRMEIFSYHTAPVQVLYLGWPGTSGANFYDYVLADPFVLPKENFEYFSEKVVWLPHCYQPNDGRRRVAGETPDREACQLPQDAFIFCCFNNPFKILPEIFGVWMRLLQQVTGSVLWLMQSDQEGQANLRREARKHGVDETRLIFAPRLPNDQHLARLGHADLFLDTIPYNAHTTASDALWQRVPVITCTGRTFASRVATSLLHNVGLPEFAVTSLSEYEALALRVARDSTLAKAIKKQLLDQRSIAPLYQTTRLARDIEKAYQAMLHRFDQGLAPDFLDMRALGD
jgi:protein O-GlcNAc transferase